MGMEEGDSEAPGRPRPMTAQQFATWAGIPASTVYRLMEHGDLPSFRLGRRRFLSAKALDALEGGALDKAVR